MIFAISLPIIAFVVILISYLCYRIAFFSPKKDRNAIHTVEGAQYADYQDAMRRIFVQLAQRPYEDVTITSHDGLILSAKYYHIRDGAPLGIAFHGYRSCGLTDFAGGSELCFEAGQNLLLVDQRAHGKSQGDSITFGILERRDCLDWIYYAVQRFGSDIPILLYGVSMGATTVLMASELDLPENVKGIIADCPYCSAAAIIKKVCKDRGYPPNLCYPFILIGALLFGRFRLWETTAAKAVRRTTVPIVIIHGEQDGFVPCDMSEEVSSARADMVTRYTFPGADHGISYLVDTPRYKKIVNDFLDAVL